MDWYLPENETIGPYRALKNRVTKEVALAGKYGEIWQYNDTHCYALIRSAKIGNKYCDVKGKIGDEFLKKFPMSELKKWISLLKIPANRPSLQLKWMENV